MIFEFSTQTFGPSLSERLLRELLNLLHLSVSQGVFITLHLLVRKIAHLTEYAIFSLLLYRSLLNRSEYHWCSRTALWTVVIAGLYSLTDEFHQSLVPERVASLKDCGIDTVGATLAMLGLYEFHR